MNNRSLRIAFIIWGCCCLTVGTAMAQQLAVGFRGISVSFKTKTSQQSSDSQPSGSVYFDGRDDTETHSRVHRIITDNASRSYFGYDVEVDPVSIPGKFKVSIKPLSITPPEQLRLRDLTVL